MSASGYAGWNPGAAYRIGRAWALRMEIFNFFEQRASAASYYYTSRLRGADAASHSLESRSARLTLARTS